jgi:hypothetical protein
MASKIQWAGLLWVAGAITAAGQAYTTPVRASWTEDPETTATITWDTPSASRGTVRYGTTTNYTHAVHDGGGRAQACGDAARAAAGNALPLRGILDGRVCAAGHLADGAGGGANRCISFSTGICRGGSTRRGAGGFGPDRGGGSAVRRQSGRHGRGGVQRVGVRDVGDLLADLLERVGAGGVHADHGQPRRGAGVGFHARAVPPVVFAAGSVAGATGNMPTRRATSGSWS